MTAALPLAGQRVLVVEDEFFQAREVKAVLEEAGAEVLGPVGRIAEAEELLARECPDAAVIDINLGGRPDFSVAARLRDSGTPMVFLTGYDQHAIPDELRSVPRLEKPASARHIVEIVQSLRRGA